MEKEGVGYIKCEAAEKGSSWYIREDSKIWKAATYTQ